MAAFADNHMLDLAHQRRQMIDLQVAGRGITNPLVLEAMRRVPRERFVSQGLEEFAYEDSPLPIEAGQTISQPYVIAAMIAAAEVQPGDRVLEIGTGSGYAAAVLSVIADQVYTIERHPDLAEQAKKRFRELGYDNIEVRVGDGTPGWPEAAPFDAIIGTAAGPRVPKPLREQLTIGGRLVMPVGERERQRLVRIRRVAPDAYEEDDLGDVRFVPLIGEHGWTEGERRQSRHGGDAVRTRPPDVASLVAAAAEPLPEFDDPAFGRMFDRFADARVVLLGEASHGTSEFYRARAAITRRLIEQHGFSIVAVEADWPDAAAIDRHVRNRAPAGEAERAFRRFPTWMWRITDVDAFVRWLRTHNGPLPAARRAGFYGLDLYNLAASIRAVLNYLDNTDPEAAKVARERYGCLMPWQNEPQTYGRMAITSGYAKCEAAVVTMLNDLLQKELDYRARDSEGFIDAARARGSFETPRPTIARCILGPPNPGICATGTCSTPSIICFGSREPARRPWCGHTILTSATPRSPKWGWCARRSTSATSAARNSARLRCSSASERISGRWLPRPTGTARWR
jgi:protein-L-isoaspartate(D-aspartate) O-methyltransferase